MAAFGQPEDNYENAEEESSPQIQDLSFDSRASSPSITTSTSPSTPQPQPSIHDLESRCQVLLNELESFRAHIRSLNRENVVETATLRHTIQSELKSLQKASALDSQTDGLNDRKMHILRSSNLPFLEAVWNTAKRSAAVTGFSKRMYWESTKHKQNPANANVTAIDTNGEDASHQPQQFPQPRHRRHFAIVDIIASGGTEWIKISSISEQRLIFELAGQGWHEDDSVDGSEEDLSDTASLATDDSNTSATGTRGISIVRIAENLARAAQATRIRYRHPRIRFILPKITPGKIPQIDAILAAVRATGALVETADTYTTDSLPIATAMPAMTYSPTSYFTSTINIDCTILLALVSDLSHARSIPTEPWFHKAMRRQIEREEAENLLPKVLYPAMVGRELVCTAEAATRMREIVETIGTADERGRTRLLLGDGVEAGGAEERRKVVLEGLRALSQYDVPEDWRLPVTIIDAADADASIENPDSVLAANVAPHLSAINRSIFLYGWRKGYTTITSNRTVAKQIERLVTEEMDKRDGNGGGEEEVGPDLWVCTCSRSLIGKEKGRR